MRYKRAKIDSLNLSAEQLEAVFIYHQDYSVQTVKSKAVFSPILWSDAFGQSLKQNIKEAKIIHTYLGLRLPLKTFSVTPNRQTLEFAGLHGYNERSRLLLQTFRELENQLMYARVTRIDIALDYLEEIPKGIIKALSKNRKPFRYGLTTYWKTPKEKGANQKMDIKIYNKFKKEKIKNDDVVMRLEFVFKGSYLKGYKLKDLDKLSEKIQKSIKKATGVSVKIEKI
ncbi:MAG TPA: hypothetical protein CFH81_06980 [Sulfurovum sp. UBA12169]|nr:MAG TPA: hypothetical protein CFH81_06980 [Sulfurovum sp. UBA12169]